MLNNGYTIFGAACLLLYTAMALGGFELGNPRRYLLPVAGIAAHPRPSGPGGYIGRSPGGSSSSSPGSSGFGGGK